MNILNMLDFYILAAAECFYFILAIGIVWGVARYCKWKYRD